MTDQNSLEDTSDSILPIKNALGLSAEVFNEILREFDRACKSKKIERNALVNYMTTRTSWKIKCVAIGSVSNVLINMGNDCDEQLGILNSIGEEMVVDEIIRAIINELGNKADGKTNGKKSTSKIPHSMSSATIKKKDPQGQISSAIQYHKPKSNNNGVMLIMFSLVGVIVIAVVFHFINSDSKTTSAPAVSDPIVNNDAPIETIKPKELPKAVIEETVQKPPEIKKEHSILSPYTGPMLAKEGIIIFQSGQDNFIGGEMVTVSSNKKKKNSSPFLVGNMDGTSYTLLKIDLRNIPKDASIENATLRLNVTSRGDASEQFQIYCLPAKTGWSFSSAMYNASGGDNEITFANLVKNKNSPLAQKAVITLRNDWISFNITSLVQDWVSNKSDNNGVVIFTETNAEVFFEGFDSFKKMMTPKLAISFGTPPKATDTNLANTTKTVDALPEKNEPSDVSNKPKSQTAKPEKEVVENKVSKPKDSETETVLKNLEGTDTDTDDKNSAKEPGNVFEDDPDLQTKENEKAKTAEVKKKSSTEQVAEKKPEKVAAVKPPVVKPENTADITLKAPNVLNKARLIEASELIKIENQEAQGEIRYTTDGREPNADSLLYSEPIKLIGTNLHILKTAVFVDRVRKSPISESEFRLIGGSGQLIDNNMSSCKKSGNWESGKSKANYYGKDYVWEQRGKGTVEWVPSLNKKTNCEVYIWLPDGDNTTRPKQAPLTIKFDGGTKEIPLDQTNRNNGWVYLGTYPMKSGSGSVLLTNDNSGKMFVADAVYFLFLPDAPGTGN